jgi:hypothetical protein
MAKVHVMELGEQLKGQQERWYLYEEQIMTLSTFTSGLL